MNTTSGTITLCYWPSGMQVKIELRFHLDLHTGRPLRIVPPEDEHIVARNM